MGYYSEVAFAIPKKDVSGLIAALKEKVGNADDLFNMEMYETTFTKFARTEKERKSIPFIIFYENWTKWYEGYDDVDCIGDYLRSLDCYKFIRVGEETGDDEENEYGEVDFDGFHICRSIDGVYGHPVNLDELEEG